MSAAKSAGMCIVVATVAGIAVAQRAPDRGPAVLNGTGPSSAAAFAPGYTVKVAAEPEIGGDGIQRFHPGLPSGGSLILQPDRLGQFHATMEVEGRSVPVLVDTGASLVALSAEIANQLGFFPAPADFTLRMQTANGIVRGAPVDLPEVHLGPLVARHVRAVVSPPGAMPVDALLGMSFLRGLSDVSMQGGRLTLTQ